MALKMNLEDSKKVFFYIKIPVHKESQATNYIGKSKKSKFESVPALQSWT